MHLSENLSHIFEKPYFPIIEEVTGRPIHEIITTDFDISNEELDKINTLIDRVKHGEPIQYVLGYAYFYRDKFFVNRNVLIPRPETEFLVDNTIQHINSLKTAEDINIFDVCTGSGCIGISISKYVSVNHNLYMSDVSDGALEVCTLNTKNLLKGDENIHILNSNLLSSFIEKDQRVIDVLIANPPYIPSGRIPTLEKNVKDFEPILALDGGNDGSDLIKKLLEEAKALLKPNAYIFIEIDEAHANEVKDFASKLFEEKEVNLIKDLTGRDRFLNIK